MSTTKEKISPDLVTLEIEFSIDNHAGFPPPVCGVWIDVDNDDNYENAERVGMTPEAGALVWKGLARVLNPDGLVMLLTYIANPGPSNNPARWSISVKSGDDKYHAVSDRPVKEREGMYFGRLKKKEKSS